EEALDALAELLAPLDVDLLHPELARLEPGRWRERGNALGDLVVERDVGHQVLDDRERPDRADVDRLVLGEGTHPGHAHQPWLAVDLGAPRTALARLAVPPAREVARLRRLDAVDDVEDDLALVHLDRVIAEAATLGVPTPHLELG